MLRASFCMTGLAAVISGSRARIWRSYSMIAGPSEYRPAAYATISPASDNARKYRYVVLPAIPSASAASTTVQLGFSGQNNLSIDSIRSVELIWNLETTGCGFFGMVEFVCPPRPGWVSKRQGEIG